jgi:hypothetical protein
VVFEPVGIALGLSTSTFDLGPDAIAVRDAERDPEEARRWRFDLLRVGRRHACAVAIRGDDCRAGRARVRTVDFAAAVAAGRRAGQPPPRSSAASTPSASRRPASSSARDRRGE